MRTLPTSEPDAHARSDTTLQAGPEAHGGGGLSAQAGPVGRMHEAGETCRMCGRPLGSEHRHVLEVTSRRRVIGVCLQCARQFDSDGGRLRLIPSETHLLGGIHIPAAFAPQIAPPTRVVLFVRRSSTGRVVAMQPRPSGVADVPVPPEAWGALIEANPALREMQADVEALLIHCTGKEPRCYLAPIDVCFQLVGIIRVHGQGPAGGVEVWPHVERFFAGLDAQASYRSAGLVATQEAPDA